MLSLVFDVEPAWQNVREAPLWAGDSLLRAKVLASIRHP